MARLLEYRPKHGWPAVAASNRHSGLWSPSVRRRRHGARKRTIRSQALLLALLWSGLLFGATWIGYHDQRPWNLYANSTGPTAWRQGMSTCFGPVRVTCLVDGDTGWEMGRKWRLGDIDAPELSKPRCPEELERARAAQDRLTELMRDGYRIHWRDRDDRYGRTLVDVQLADGRWAAEVLMDEGLARPWTGRRKPWC